MGLVLEITRLNGEPHVRGCGKRRAQKKADG